ncbi:hypothetical protein N7532_001806 [Penicillium argentinense]|uniref:NmrA-like domain-containing protein n=1 Tax=Penicillium argentinense TaxID=1131581 RepID=A0A9W9KMT0_9EURO|nr:uncharacterized protein N7532_001806 [Penicillium argentinense]KAJ5111271.1 hypothetical protein N7532_001806 [Penicillium argentinense]
MDYPKAGGILTPDFFGEGVATYFKMALKGKPLQLGATSDIVGDDGFLNPEHYQDKAISLAGDELTFDQMAQVFSRQMGQTLPPTFPICSLFMASLKDMGYMLKWFPDEGYGADIQSLRGIHPEIKTRHLS